MQKRAKKGQPWLEVSRICIAVKEKGTLQKKGRTGVLFILRDEKADEIKTHVARWIDLLWQLWKYSSDYFLIIQ